MKRDALAPCLLLVLLPLLGACSRDVVPLSGQTRARVDFSGHWEIDYRQSERVQENYEMLRAMASRLPSRSRGRFGVGWLPLPSGELIRLADSVASAAVLQIEQDEVSIEVEREDDFPLYCHFGEQVDVSDDPLATERCGWDYHQLVFDFELPDDLAVTHRLTLAPGGEHLNVATTVRTRGRGQEFTLNRVYRRFEPLENDYRCVQTVDGTRDCTLGAGSDTVDARP